MPNRDAADKFIAACLLYLRSGGRLLLGDLPNHDMKARFLAAADNRRFDAEWQTRMLHIGEQDRSFLDLMNAANPDGGVFLTDSYALELAGRLRSEGLDCFLVPQPPGLPFDKTREDILIWKRN